MDGSSFFRRLRALRQRRRTQENIVIDFIGAVYVYRQLLHFVGIHHSDAQRFGVRDDGTEPVLVLDDVFAELDTSRRDRLAGAIADAEQVLITAAVGSDVPNFPTERRFRVDAGTVWEETPDD